MIITTHAAQCFVERIDPHLSIEEARARIETSAPIVAIAAAFRARVVRRTDAKLILIGETVVTVYPRHARKSA